MLMRKFLILLSLIFFDGAPCYLSAQGWLWRIPAMGDAKILKDHSNDVYMWAGDMSSTTIKKYNSSGSLLWTKTISGNISLTGVKTDVSNNLLILGNFNAPFIIDGITLTPNGPVSFFLLKISPSSALISANGYE